MAEKLNNELLQIIKDGESITTDDRDDIRTNLIDSYFRLMEFCDKHLDDRFYREDSQRKDIRSIIAREICANLLIHREFSNPFPAKLIIEKDRIITENANKAKQIGKLDANKFTAYPKNPKIAKVFHELGLADELGSGVRNLFKYAPIYSEGRNPEFVENDIFQTIVPINYKYESTTTPTTTPTKDELLNESQKEIIELISSNPNIKQEEIAEKLNISIDGVKYNMKILKEKKYIERIGRNNNGYWKILK